MFTARRILSDKAQAHTELFELLGVFERSRQKFQSGVRTRKEFVRPGEWAQFTNLYGGQFLVSLYGGGTLCVVTTPRSQYGFLTEEMPNAESLLRDREQNGAVPYLVSHAPDGTVKTAGFNSPTVEPTAADGQHRH